MYLRIKRELESSTGKITSLSASRGRLDFMREENMKVFISNRQQAGQTLIETALILFLILLILLGISEFSRAWFVKNSLKNAARSGARVAVVTPDITDVDPALPCPQAGDRVINTVCTSPGVGNNSKTSVKIDILERSGSVTARPNDTVTITVHYIHPRFFVVGGSPWPWSKDFNTWAEASMRYE